MADRDGKKRPPNWKKQQVYPQSINEELELESKSANMDDGDSFKHGPVTSTLKFDTLAKVVNKAKQKADRVSNSYAFQAIAFAKQFGNKWREYCTQRRFHRKSDTNAAATLTGDDDEDKPQLSGSGLGEIHRDFVNHAAIVQRQSKGLLKPPASKTKPNISMIVDSNLALLSYFTTMCDSVDQDAKINLEFIESLLNNGADINTCDKYGQGILHETARAWHVDVSKWLIENGANVNLADEYGRTPLHVAAAVDCPEMVYLFIDNGAEKEAMTKGDRQTPVFFAAKSDATSSLRALIKRGCMYKSVRDYKDRTPLHLAAELDRSDTARLLLELRAPVGVQDNRGQKAITWMITKMAPVAKEALSQFHHIDRHNRKQLFHINLLVQDRDAEKKVVNKMEGRPGCTQSPLSVAVAFKQYDLLLHPTFIHLLNAMWIMFARFWAYWNLALNLIYILLWTWIGLIVEYDKRHMYVFPQDWYRILLWIIAVGTTAWQIVDEIREFVRSKRNHSNWETWRQLMIKEDLKFCHPQWPEEREYLESELTALSKLSPKYFNDAWNIFDWLCYVMLLIDTFTHVADIINHSELLARVHIRLMAVTIILLWLRLMKSARPFSLLGPFIVMLGHMLTDCVRFLFIYAEFFFPFMAAFWMIYGGTKVNRNDLTTEVIVDGFQYPGQLFFSLVRLTLVDSYDYENMKDVDNIFTDIILIVWFFLSSILCLNLFIALLSETFQRVYDNAQANSVMQKAIIILNIWDGLSTASKIKFYDYIAKQCSPIEEYYDDDQTLADDDDLKKVTFQIKESLEEFTGAFKLHFPDITASEMPPDNVGRPGEGGGGRSMRITNKMFVEEMSAMQKHMEELQLKQENFMEIYKRDMDSLKTVLKQLSNKLTVPSTTAGILQPYNTSPAVDSQQSVESTTPVSKLKRKKKHKASPVDMHLNVETLQPSSDVLSTDTKPPQ